MDCGFCMQQRSSLEKLLVAGAAPDSVVTYLGAPARQDMLEEAADELQGGQGDAAHLLAAVVTITEGDLAVAKRLQAAVGDGDAEDVAAQVLENLIATAGRLAVDHPV